MSTTQHEYVGPIGAWDGDANESPEEVAAATLPRTGVSVLDIILAEAESRMAGAGREASTADLDMRDRNLQPVARDRGDGRDRSAVGGKGPGAAWAAWQAHEEGRAISERVLAAHDEQVSRMTKVPPPPARGTVRWSVMLGGWQFEPENEDVMDALIDAVKGGGIKVTIHF